ncbi:hypothetical protein [Gordonia soli]|uniref:Uncharacterized protein n=1 Tax=Gordonia soli NBRC 108243 TaxID=1223545 RepID=M0QG34_9ACTN|nr:hypothetical protein [Gordonia soli]GAC67543.1 hypothetical protein GS4_08_01280 [Gordonia soli NBRC 108243]
MHTPKIIGLTGFILLMLGLVLVALAIGRSAGDHSGSVPVVIAAVAVLLLALVLLGVSKYVMAERRVTNRTQRDPLQPETTEVDETRYEERFHHTDPDAR